MPRGEQYTFRDDDDAKLGPKIEAHRRQQGYEYDSEAIKDLLSIGYREAKAPMLYRAFDLAFGAAFYLTVTAIVTVIAAYMTPVMRAWVGVRIALVMVAIAVGLLGIVELARLVNGQNELGEQVARIGGLF